MRQGGRRFFLPKVSVDPAASLCDRRGGHHHQYWSKRRCQGPLCLRNTLHLPASAVWARRWRISPPGPTR